MKLFFNASISGKKLFLSEYQAIFEELKKSEAVLLPSPVFPGSIEKVSAETVEEAESFYKKLKSWINKSDICVFEASYPSLGIGHEIAMALQSEKPVIVFFLHGKKPYILEGVTDDRLQLVEYSIDTLHEIVSESLSYASEQQDTRFNFFISPKIGNFLDWMSKKKRLPRAVYLRKLIEEDMKKNKDFES